MLEVRNPQELLREYPALYVRRAEYQQWVMQLHKLLDETAEAQMNKGADERIEELLCHFLAHSMDISFQSLGRGQFLYRKGRKISVLLQVIHPDKRGEMISRRELQRKAFFQLLQTASTYSDKQFPTSFLITNVYEWYLMAGEQVKTVFNKFPLEKVNGNSEQLNDPFINRYLGRHKKTFFDTLLPWNWNLYGLTDILQENKQEVTERLLSSFSLLKNAYGLKDFSPEPDIDGSGKREPSVRYTLFLPAFEGILQQLDELDRETDYREKVKGVISFTNWEARRDWVIEEDELPPVDMGRVALALMKENSGSKMVLVEGKQHEYFRQHIEEAILEYLKAHHSVWKERVRKPQDTFLLSRKESNEALNLLKNMKMCDPDLQNAYFLRTFCHSLIHIMATYGLLRLPGGAFIGEGEAWWDGINWQIRASQERQLILRKALYKQFCYTYTQQVFGLSKNTSIRALTPLLIWIDLWEQARYLRAEKPSAVQSVWEVACKHIYQKSALPYRIHLGMGIEKVRELQSYTPDGGQMEWRTNMPELWDEESNFSGFDLILSQPSPASCSILSPEEKSILKLRYDTYSSQGNQASCLVELGLKLTKPSGSVLAVLPSRLWTGMAHQRFQDYLEKWEHEIEEIPQENGMRKDLCLLWLTPQKVQNPASSKNQGLLFQQ